MGKGHLMNITGRLLSFYDFFSYFFLTQVLLLLLLLLRPEQQLQQQHHATDPTSFVPHFASALIVPSLPSINSHNRITRSLNTAATTITSTKSTITASFVRTTNRCTTSSLSSKSSMQQQQQQLHLSLLSLSSTNDDENNIAENNTNNNKLPFYFDPNTKGGIIVLSIVLFLGTYIADQILIDVFNYDDIEAGITIGMGFTVLSTLAWMSTYLFRVATKDMTYAKQLKDYENAVIAKRLEELDDDEVQALVDEVSKDTF